MMISGTGLRSLGRFVEQQLEQRARRRLEQQQPEQQEQQQRVSGHSSHRFIDGMPAVCADHGQTPRPKNKTGWPAARSCA